MKGIWVGNWVGNRFHFAWDIWRGGATRGPLGLGLRVFFWERYPHGWAWSIDILLPVVDVQFGFHHSGKESA